MQIHETYCSLRLYHSVTVGSRHPGYFTYNNVLFSILEKHHSDISGSLVAIGVAVSDFVIQHPKPLFLSAWMKRTPRPAALEQLQKHLCYPKEKSTLTLRETQHS